MLLFTSLGAWLVFHYTAQSIFCQWDGVLAPHILKYSSELWRPLVGKKLHKKSDGVYFIRKVPRPRRIFKLLAGLRPQKLTVPESGMPRNITVLDASSVVTLSVV